MFLVSIFLFISFHASVLHWNNDGMKFKCWVSLLAIQDLSADLMYSTGNISCLHHVMCWTPDIDTRPAPAAWFSSVFPQVSVLQSLLLNCPSLSLPVNDWFVMNVTFKMFSILFCWRTMDFCLQVNIELHSVLLLTCHWLLVEDLEWLKLLQNLCVH